MPSALQCHWPILPGCRQQALWHIHIKIELNSKKNLKQILIELRLKMSEFVPKDLRCFTNKCSLNSKKQRLNTLVC